MGFVQRMIRKFKRTGSQEADPTPAYSDTSSTVASSVADIPAHLPVNYLSHRSRDILESLQPIIRQNSTWSKSANKNILLPPEHVKLREYIHSQFINGCLSENKVLRQQSPEQILSSLHQAWVIQQQTAPASSQRSLTKTLSNSVYNSTVGLAYRSSTHAQAAKIEPLSTEQIYEDLMALFSPLIQSIKNDYSHDLEGLLRRWVWESKQSPKSLPFLLSNQVPADQVIRIQEKAYEIQVLYETTAESFNENAFKENGLPVFVEKACTLLQDYYHELLKLNGDLGPDQTAHWKEPSVVKALKFYFKQREYLFKIICLANKIPDEEREHKLQLMRDYQAYIIEKHQREALYLTNYPFPLLGVQVSFGLDKWSKLDAAMEQYRACCDFPGEIVPLPAPENYERVRCAGEDGNLRTLKGRGLFFRYEKQQDLSDTDPFKPLPILRAVEPIKPYSASLNL